MVITIYKNPCSKFGVGCLLAMFAFSRYLNRAERAAYLEGRYDLDHATAWRWAK